MQEKLKSILNNLNDRHQFLRSSTIDLSSIKELYSFYSDELTQALKSSTLSNSQPAIEKNIVRRCR